MFFSRSAFSSLKSGVQFSNLWFIFHSSTWSFHKPYFSRKQIFHKSYRAKKTQMVVKPVNKYQIMQYCHYFKNILSVISSIIHFFLSKSFVNIIFHWAKNNKLKNKINNHYAGARKNIFLNYATQGNLIWPLAEKCIISKN